LAGFAAAAFFFDTPFVAGRLLRFFVAGRLLRFNPRFFLSFAISHSSMVTG
jgi:hypothetical protein